MSESKKTVSVELRPDRKLIDSKFESYRLSLNPLPSYKATLSDGVYRVKPRDDDFSYEKMRCLTMHNYLVLDPWNKANVYFVDSNLCIRRYHIPLETNIEAAKSVFRFESKNEASNKNLPPTMYFPTATVCITCDGCGSIYIIDTGCRNELQNSVWKTIYFDKNQEHPAMVVHGVVRSTEDVEFIDCLLVRFQEDAAEKEKKKRDFIPKVNVEWLSLERNKNEEKFNFSQKEFQGKTLPSYCVLTSDCSEMQIASSSPFQYLFADVEPQVNFESIPNDLEKLPAPYKWKQSKEDVSVFVDLPSNATAASVAYILTSKTINIGVRPLIDAEPETVLEGNLFMEAIPDESSWIICDGRLEVTIQKLVEGQSWFSVVDGDDQGQLDLDPEDAARIHKQLEHLTSETLDTDNPADTVFNPAQLEECDSYYDSSASLAVFNKKIESFTHHANISSLRWLFNCILDPREPPALVLRHDVDAILWQPMLKSEGLQTVSAIPWKHVATFNALGYVHASKNNLKFCSSAPNTSFAVLCECQKRIFVYWQPSPLETTSQNCNTKELFETVAIQQVASLDGNDDILGLVTSNERMYVLTTRELIVIKVAVDAGA